MSCSSSAPKPKLPEGMTLEAMRAHPTWSYWVDWRLGCQLPAGHVGQHRNGLLVWWDPPIVVHEQELVS